MGKAGKGREEMGKGLDWEVSERNRKGWVGLGRVSKDGRRDRTGRKVIERAEKGF